MAVIKEYNSGGTLIRICDDYMPKTEEENKQRYSLLDEIARRISERNEVRVNAWFRNGDKRISKNTVWN